jgi:hypothetical protein
MKEREFKKLVFENFVQAKKELIREGYLKKTDNLNFEDVFSETKKKVLEEKVKSLQRENEMLKSKLSQRRGLKEAGTMTAAGMGKQGGGAGNEGLWRSLSKVFASLGVKDAIADTLINKLEASDKKNYGNIKSILKDNSDISKFKIKVKGFLDSGMKLTTSIKMALDELKKQNAQSNLSESRRRRRY